MSHSIFRGRAGRRTAPRHGPYKHDIASAPLSFAVEPLEHRLLLSAVLELTNYGDYGTLESAYFV